MFKSRTHKEQAILIEKKNVLSSLKPTTGMKLFRMKYGMHDYHNDKPAKKKRFYRLDFMTEKGKRSFDVHVADYANIEIDELGTLTTKGRHFISFEKEKIATKKDVAQLGWN